MRNRKQKLRIFFMLLVCMAISTTHNSVFGQKKEPWCEIVPWLCDDHMPGFPGSSGPAQLQEVTITGQRQNPWWPFGFPSTPPPPGWSLPNPNPPVNQPPKKPCAGDPLIEPALAPSKPGNYTGGTYGFTRMDKDGNPKFHDGVDITAVPGTPVFNMYEGVVTNVVSSFLPGEYKKASYGNYVEVKSIINGETVYLKYNHLDEINPIISVGFNMDQGLQLGKSGTTGNAAAAGVIPHVHIQAKDADRKRKDPEPLIPTKFDKSTGKGTNPCP